MQSIPMVDLKLQYAELQTEIEENILSALKATQFILGPNVQDFEKESAQWLGVKHAIGVASGTDALHLALIASGVKAGDEVITSPFTFIATAEAIAYIGAKPVFVDIDPNTFNLDLRQVAKAITPLTKAVLPVHIFGQPVDMPALQQLADENDLVIVEDCAQSFGASVAGKMTGGHGMAGAFSFFPSKNLGGYGDGGLITTNSDEVMQRIKSLRNHGMGKERYYHDEIGFNSRLDELQAVILRSKLTRMEQYNQGRRRAAHNYSEQLAEVSCLQTPVEDAIGEHVYHQYTLLIDNDFSGGREAIQQALQAAGVANAIYYPVPLHKQNVFAEECMGVSLPITEDISNRCFSLPIYPELNDQQIDYICNTIRQICS